MLNKTDIFYQTNRSDSTTGADYYFIIIIVLKGLFIYKNNFVYQQTLILCFAWWCFEERSKFYQKLSTDGASTFKCIGSD